MIGSINTLLNGLSPNQWNIGLILSSGRAPEKRTNPSEIIEETNPNVFSVINILTNPAIDSIANN